MLDIRFVRENPDAVKENIKKKFQAVVYSDNAFHTLTCKVTKKSQYTDTSMHKMPLKIANLIINKVFVLRIS